MCAIAHVVQHLMEHHHERGLLTAREKKKKLKVPREFLAAKGMRRF